MRTVQAQEAQKAEDKRPPDEAKDKQEGISQQANLMEAIKQLQDEVKQLRRELNQIKAERSAGREGGEREQRSEGRNRDGEGIERERPKDGEGLEGRGPGDEEVFEKRKAKTRGDRASKKRKGLPEAVNLQSSGVIKEVTEEGKAQKLTLSVKEDGKEMELVCVLGEGTQIMLNGKEAEFEDLKPGDYAECEYILKGDKMVAVARVITAKRRPGVEQAK
jgi:hypothetical protein